MLTSCMIFFSNGPYRESIYSYNASDCVLPLRRKVKVNIFQQMIFLSTNLKVVCLQRSCKLEVISSDLICSYLFAGTGICVGKILFTSFQHSKFCRKPLRCLFSWLIFVDVVINFNIFGSGCNQKLLKSDRPSKF